MNKTLLQNKFPAILTFTTLIMVFFGNIPSSYAEGGEGKRCAHHKGKMFERIDVNNDGVLTLEEFTDKAERRFIMMDADNDGKVTKEEAKKYHAAKREKYKKHHEENKSAY